MELAGYDTSLTKKLKILFKEQGITIASIVSAVGLLISTIVLAVTGGGAGAAAAGGSASKGFIQKQFEKLGNFLKYLAVKAGAALPGIIGTVVSFFFRVAAKIVEFAAKHPYMAIAGVIAFAVGYMGRKGKRS